MTPALLMEDRASFVRPKGRALTAALIGVAYLSLTACYLSATVSTSHTISLKLDEVLAVWAARLPTFADVADAIWHGSEFSPPTYDMILHAIFAIFGSEKLVARLPSIIAILITASVMARLVTKRLNDASFGVLIFGLILDSRLFYYAIQARPYALLIAIEAIALLIWSGTPDEKAGPIRALAMAFCLAASISLHVYGVVGLFVFALMECLWSLAERRLRLPIWGAILLAGIVSFAWLPLIKHLATFNSGDTSAPQYYAKPTLDGFLNAVIGLSPLREVLIASAGLVVGSVLIQAWRGWNERASYAPAGAVMRSMTLALLAAFPLAFLFSLLVTHSFSLRYALPAALGSAFLVALCIRRCPNGRLVALLMVPVMCYGLQHRPIAVDYTARFLALITSHPAADPVVVGEGGPSSKWWKVRRPMSASA